MAGKSLLTLIRMGLLIGLVLPTFLPVLREEAGALDKEKIATPVKLYAPFYLAILAAEEKGFWKENGLEIEWIPFRGGTAMTQAVAGRDINIGLYSAPPVIVATARDVPVFMVAHINGTSTFNIWVRGDSPYKQVRDLKGKRIAVTQLGSATWVAAQVVVKAHGVEKDVRFVGAGDVPTMFAGLRSGAFEAMTTSTYTAASFKVDGTMRDIASADDALPKPWIGDSVFARKDFSRSKPDMVRRMIKALFQATSFLKANPRWAIEKIKSLQGISEEAAKVVYENLQFTPSPRIDRKAVENMRKLFIDYGVISDKAPAVDDLFTNDYIP